MGNYKQEIKDILSMMEALENKRFTAKKHQRQTLSINEVFLMNRLVKLLPLNDTTHIKIQIYARSVPRIHTNWDACKHYQRLLNFGLELY